MTNSEPVILETAIPQDMSNKGVEDDVNVEENAEAMMKDVDIDLGGEALVHTQEGVHNFPVLLDDEDESCSCAESVFWVLFLLIFGALGVCIVLAYKKIVDIPYYVFYGGIGILFMMGFTCKVTDLLASARQTT